MVYSNAQSLFEKNYAMTLGNWGKSTVRLSIKILLYSILQVGLKIFYEAVQINNLSYTKFMLLFMWQHGEPELIWIFFLFWRRFKMCFFGSPETKRKQICLYIFLLLIFQGNWFIYFVYYSSNTFISFSSSKSLNISKAFLI